MASCPQAFEPGDRISHRPASVSPIGKLARVCGAVGPHTGRCLGCGRGNPGRAAVAPTRRRTRRAYGAWRRAQFSQS